MAKKKTGHSNLWLHLLIQKWCIWPAFIKMRMNQYFLPRLAFISLSIPFVAHSCGTEGYRNVTAVVFVCTSQSSTKCCIRENRKTIMFSHAEHGSVHFLHAYNPENISDFLLSILAGNANNSARNLRGLSSNLTLPWIPCNPSKDSRREEHSCVAIYCLKMLIIKTVFWFFQNVFCIVIYWKRITFCIADVLHNSILQ